MNEELIKQYTREAYRSAYGRDIPPYNDIGKFAKELLELHHARAVAPLVEVLDEAYGELVADSTRDGARCLLLTQIEKALAPFQQGKANAAD